VKLNNIKLAPLMLGLTLAGATPLAQAIEVFPIVKEVKSETPRDNFVTVKSMFQAQDSVNPDKVETRQYEFVTLELYEIKNPGADKEIFEKELGKKEPSLMFSPTRLVIPYGEERKVRLLPLKPVDHERVYRLRIRPSYPEQALEKDKIRFAIGYDVLLRYLPDGKRAQGIEMRCQNNQWTITATGNVRSEMHNLVIDGRKNKAQFNVYPGYPRSLTVNRQLAFEMDKKTYVYDQCRLKE